MINFFIGFPIAVIGVILVMIAIMEDIGFKRLGRFLLYTAITAALLFMIGCITFLAEHMLVWAIVRT
jgi:hypothetical protein